MKQRGFTIVEFIIAISIGVILLSVGIPRYNTFIQKQQFLSQVNEIASCFQEAQRYAVAPPQADAQFFSADLLDTTVGGKPANLCTPSAYYQDAGGNFKLLSSFKGHVHTAEQVIAQTDVVTGADPLTTHTVDLRGGGYKFQIIYSALHSGNPVMVQNSLYPGYIEYSTLSTTPQSGFSQKIDIMSLENNHWHATIAIDRPGTPVSVTFVEM